MSATKHRSATVRVAWTLLVAAAVGACLQPPLAEGEVRLATSADGAFDVGCPAGLIDGLLIANAEAGTAVSRGAEAVPVIWPFGFSAREVSGVVEVLDPAGVAVARTGEVVALSGGSITSNRWWSTCGPPYGSPIAPP